MGTTGMAWRSARRLGDARNIGFACLVAGVLLIVAGWYGAARLDHVQGQLPYLISGGIGGLALVVAGAAMLLVDERRRQTRVLLARMGRTDGPIGGIEQGAEPHQAPGAGDVVLGTTVYHRADCRLAQARAWPHADPGQAAARGLDPCRICHPAA